ncbi:hypothetical protein GCM10020218_027740 [Dactylosporangium vinaceum]
MRGRAAAGDPVARRELAWTALRWWPARAEEAVALLPVIGPSAWLHDRLLAASRHRGRSGWCADVIALLDRPEAVAYRRTQAMLRLYQGEREAAVAQLRSLAAGGDRRAAADLASILAAPVPVREIRIGEHPDAVDPYGMSFSPDGATLAVWGYRSGGRLTVWDVATGTRRSNEPLPRLHLDGVVFGPGGAVREVRAGQRPWGPARRAAPGGRMLAVGTLRHVRLHLPAGDTIHDLATPGLSGLAFSPDGARLATGGEETRVWDVATGGLVHGIATPACDVAFPAGGAALATLDRGDAVVRLWDITGVDALV